MANLVAPNCEIFIFRIFGILGKSSGVLGYLIMGVLGYLIGVLGYLMCVLGYLVGVLGYLMGVLTYPMAWRRRQAIAKRRWGQRKWRRAPIPGPPGPRHFIGSQRHLAMAWRRRQAMGYARTPIK